MFGYIRPSKPHLSEQDEARFQSVYCGLCHELGRKYGFAARFVLNFDFTFLAILLSDAQEPECESCRCAAHPCKAQCALMAAHCALHGCAAQRQLSHSGSCASESRIARNVKSKFSTKRAAKPYFRPSSWHSPQ